MRPFWREGAKVGAPRIPYLQYYFPFCSSTAIPFQTQDLRHYVHYRNSQPLSFVPFTTSSHLIEV